MAKEIDLLERQRRLAWYLIVPAVLVVFLVIGYPLVQVLVYSVLKYKLDGVTPPSFVGLGNYQFVLTDGDFWLAVTNTLIFAVCSVTLEAVLGLAVALVANSDFKGRSFLRIAILIPWAIPTVVSSKIWAWMFNDIYGVVNVILTNFHLIPQKIAFLAQPITALPVIIAVDVWKTTPFMALLLLAGLGLIPADLYEAAAIDGATKVRQFFSLTLPLIMPTLLVALIFRTLDALRVFDIFYVMVGGQGNMATMAIYNQQWLVSFLDAGVGSACSVIILVIIMVFVVLYTRFSKTSFQ
ncbi:MAG: sugar ABC transporter permease [Verrucomicrobia bacterium]|nr:sugar ABC transporter permease [Verrucomicrobiota bacterium]MBV9129121.1 sugar ABC transporter permease [Verrucomicrobiota bacterium]MBV9644585.1 sugar ABC transporter permease [Verrucomicrobiota bacterium]